jgi:HEAT repeat protein
MPESMETIALALEDRHAEVRRSAVLALGVMVPRILGESLEQKDDGSRPAKMSRPDSIFRIRFRDFCRRQLADLAREDVFRVRAAACVTLGQVGGPKDRELLETLLNDGNQDIGNLAAIGLGILGRRGFDPEKSGWKSLRDAFEKSVAHDRSGALALALGLYGEKAATGLISKRLRETEARRLQAYFFMALAILGQMPSEKVVTELLLASRDEDTLQDTLLGLSLVPARQEVVSLLHEKLVEGEDLRERAIAATGLVLLGSVPDAEPVSMLIGRSEIPGEFRSMIIEGLGMAGNERGMNPVAYLTLGFNEAHATAAERFLMSLKW